MTIKKILNELIQLQDLFEARAQQEATAGGSVLEQLEKSIEDMMKDLDPDIATRFRRLQQKWHVAIVPVTNGVCNGCGMALPVSQVHEVHAALTLHHCPNCTRFLFYPDNDTPRGHRRKAPILERPKVGLARFSAPELMIPSLKASTREEALQEICAVLQANEFVDNGERLASDALKREAIASTALEDGIAFPHVRGVEGGGLTLAMGVSKKGIRYDAEARQLTRIIFFVTIPSAASAFYLKLLSGLNQACRVAENREKLIKAVTTDELWKTLLAITKKSIK